MNKTISFMVKLDTSDVDGQIDKIKKKLTDAYRPGANAQSLQNTQQRAENMGLASPQSKAAQDAYKRSANQSKIDLDRRIASEHKANVESQKQVVQKTAELEKHLKSQEKVVKGSKEELRITQEILTAKENIRKQNDAIAARDKVINDAMDARQKMNQTKFGKAMGDFNSGRSGGLEGLMAGGGSSMAMLGGGMAVGAMVLGAVSKAMTMAGNAYVGYNKIPMEVSQARGSAISNTYGREIGAATGGQQSYEMSFMKEKSDAMAEAKKSQDVQMATDEAQSVHGALNSSKLFTLPGMIRLGAAGLHDVFNSRTRNRDLGMLPGQTGQNFQDKYQLSNMAERSQNYQTTQQSKREANPYKTQAADYFANNGQANLATQRSLGFSDEDLTGQGGYFARGAGKGFTSSQMTGMSQDILGAGGSSRAARDSAIFGNQMSRDHDLTNAGQVMGTLSGQLGGAKESEQATIKILAEGMRLGLNAADMTEENRKFTQTVAEVVSRSGSTSPEDAADKAAQFSRFMGSNTMMGLEGAKNAFDQYQQRSSSTSGAYGVLQASSFLQDKNLKGIDPQSMSALMSTNDADLSLENPKVQDAYAQAKAKNPELTEDEFLQSIHKAKDNTQSRDPELDQRRKRLQTYMKANNIDKLDDATLGQLDEGARADYNRINTLQANAAPGMSPQMAKSVAMGFVNGVPQQRSESEQKAYEDSLNVPGMPRQQDEKNSADAASQQDVLKSFRQFHDILVPTVEAVNQFNAALRRGVESAQGTPNEKRANAYFNSVLNPSTAPENQSQAGSGKGHGN